MQRYLGLACCISIHRRRCDMRTMHTAAQTLGLHRERPRLLRRHQCVLLWYDHSSLMSNVASLLIHSVTSAFHILMDIWILVLPLRLIMRIPRQPRDKLALYIIFGLGAISTLASIIRLHFLRMFTLSNDPIYDSLPINTWSMVEVNIGILCASIPTLKPLVSKAQRNRTNSALARYSSKKAGGGAWPKDDKAAILKTGGNMMISLHPATTKGRDTKIYDEEWDLDDRPPPVPPKDDVFEDSRNPAPRKPDLVHAESKTVKN